MSTKLKPNLAILTLAVKTGSKTIEQVREETLKGVGGSCSYVGLAVTDKGLSVGYNYSYSNGGLNLGGVNVSKLEGGFRRAIIQGFIKLAHKGSFAV